MVESHLDDGFPLRNTTWSGCFSHAVGDQDVGSLWVFDPIFSPDEVIEN